MRPPLPLLLASGALTALAIFGASCGPGAPGALGAAPPAAAGPSVAADSIVVEDSTLLFFVRYRYPQLRDAGPHTDAVNRALADSARARVAWYRPEGPPPEASYSFTTEIEVGYDVDRLDDRLFSAVATFYTYTGGAHPNTHFEAINYDLVTGLPFTITDLFRPDAAALDTLSAITERWVLGEAARVGGTRDDFWEEGWAPETGNFSRFTVGADSLHVYFPPYQIAPYVAGAFAMGVPLDALRPLLAEDGPAAAFRR